MMVREGSRKVAWTLRKTLVGRFASIQKGDDATYHLSGSSQYFPTTAEITAFDCGHFGSTIGHHPPACMQNAAANQVYGILHPSDYTRDAFVTRVCRAFGDTMRAESSKREGPRFRPWLVGVSCLAHQAKTSSFFSFHECAPLLADSFQMKRYSIQTRHLASDSGKPFQQTYGKRPLDSNVKKREINEENKKKISEGDDQTDKKSLGARVKNLLSDLEKVPVPALGLGLVGAIPFVALTPGIASILPLPECLYDMHIESQAAYGAVILSFLGGPHWGIAMTEQGDSQKSAFSRVSIRTLRYVWSVVPSLVAWPALLLSPVPKFVVLITSYGLVFGVDAFFTRMGLLPSWYMPLRILLTSIAMLSMTSSLIVTAATNAAAVVTQ